MLARLLLQPPICGHRMGKSGGGGLLDQSVLMSPAVVSWKAMSPKLRGASPELPRSFVVQEKTKDLFFCSLTVTFSLVGVPL